MLWYQTTSEISVAYQKKSLILIHVERPTQVGRGLCPNHLKLHLKTFLQNHGGGGKWHLENLASAVNCCDSEVTCVISSHISLARNNQRGLIET